MVRFQICSALQVENPAQLWRYLELKKREVCISQDRMLIFTTGGCGQMFEAIIVSPQFTKKTTLARHRLVNATLKEEIAAIHAWTPKCHTPEEWEKKKPQ